MGPGSLRSLKYCALYEASYSTRAAEYTRRISVVVAKSS